MYVGVRGAWPWAQCVITVGKFEPTEVPVVTYEEEEDIDAKFQAIQIGEFALVIHYGNRIFMITHDYK